MTIKIASWNVNSVNMRLSQLEKWLVDASPDIVLLQELKCVTEKFPYQQLEHLGYNIAVNGQKSYNGVAILSKYKLEDISFDLTEDPDNSHARYIEAYISLPSNKVIRIASVYVPNGQAVGSDKFTYKLKFFDALNLHLKKLLEYDEITVIGGDFNVAPEEIDVYDPVASEGAVCFNIEERAKFRRLLNLGYNDAFRLINPQEKQFSWWDYRAGAWQKDIGLRIDHMLISPETSDLLSKSYIEKHMRDNNVNEKPSDHAPIVIELNLSKN
jgi:exodeoxyribonuclease-3